MNKYRKEKWKMRKYKKEDLLTLNMLILSGQNWSIFLTIGKKKKKKWGQEIM